jgi:hypothetical protein
LTYAATQINKTKLNTTHFNTIANVYQYKT